MTVPTKPRTGLVPLTGDWIDYTYRRVSSDKQEERGMSLDVQDEETLAAIAKLDDANFGGTFTDVLTGANPERPDYQRLLAACRAQVAAGRRVRIHVVKQSRFGRDIEELSRAWKELVVGLGVELHITRDGGHARDEMMFLIKGVMNHHELTVIKEGVRNSFARGRAAGWLKPGRRRWGYAWRAWEDGKKPADAFNVYPVPHPDEADYVRELFRRRAEGASYRDLMDWVHGLPAEARGVRKKDGSCRELGFAAIANVLDSPVYVARDGKPGDDVLDRPRGKWEPLIDDETWAAVHPRTDGRENVVPISARSEYLLTRYIFCEACGGRMQGRLRRLSTRIRKGRTKPPSGRPKRQYVCGGEKLGVSLRTVVDGKRCHRSVPADTIERLVLGTFQRLVAALATPGLAKVVRDEARKLDERRAATGDARRLLNAEQNLERVRKDRSDLTRALSRGDITLEQYHEAYADVSVDFARYQGEVDDLSAIVAERKRSERRRPVVDVILDQAPFWARALEDGSVEDQRAFLRIVLDRLTPRRVGRGEYLAGMQLTETGLALLELGALVLPAAGWHARDVQVVQANCTTSTMPHGTDDAA